MQVGDGHAATPRNRGLTWTRVALAAIVIPGPAASAAGPDVCPPQTFRWAEDCRGLAGISRRGTNALRYIPLRHDGDAWLTLGGEYRLRIETVQDPDFAISPVAGFTSVTGRAYVHADVRTRAGMRLFGQISVSGEDGRLPGSRPVDTSGPDIAQLFVDVPVGPILLRFGRQEVDLGGNRLVSLRDAALRRSFDGLLLRVSAGPATITAFRLQPVAVARRSFDDARDRGDDFTGVSVALPAVRRVTTTLFAFDRRRSVARTFSAAGGEQRRTYGIRVAWRDARSDATGQVAVQEGRLAGQLIRSWGFALDAGHTLVLPSRPRIGLSFGYASGDARAGDGRIGSFDPLYPNLSVFTDAPLYYPVNQINAEANLSARPTRNLMLRFNGIMLAKASTGDAVYAASGRPLTGPGPNHLVGAVAEGTARWSVSRHVELYGSVVRAFALSAVRAADGQDTTYALVQVTTRF